MMSDNNLKPNNAQIPPSLKQAPSPLKKFLLRLLCIGLQEAEAALQQAVPLPSDLGFNIDDLSSIPKVSDPAVTNSNGSSPAFTDP
jgi:hypothetical protein